MGFLGGLNMDMMAMLFTGGGCHIPQPDNTEVPVSVKGKLASDVLQAIGGWRGRVCLLCVLTGVAPLPFCCPPPTA
jgi:hypothetical protein